MKKILFFALMGTLMLGSFTSCNNKPQEPTQEEIDAQKQALADSVLAVVDACADKYISYSDSSFRIQKFELTKAEKMVKPDYLLDPSEASKFVTKYQKVNALAIYIIEMGVREIYGMPVDETKEAIAKLAADINYPVDIEKQQKDTPRSELIKEEYMKYKGNDDLATFWQFQNAVLVEICYVIANNPDLFLSKITEEEYQVFCNRWTQLDAALEELAKYDTEILEIFGTLYDKSPEESRIKYATLEAGKESYSKDKELIIARRNALLQ